MFYYYLINAMFSLILCYTTLAKLVDFLFAYDKSANEIIYEHGYFLQYPSANQQIVNCYCFVHGKGYLSRNGNGIRN